MPKVSPSPWPGGRPAGGPGPGAAQALHELASTKIHCASSSNESPILAGIHSATASLTEVSSAKPGLRRNHQIST